MNASEIVTDRFIVIVTMYDGPEVEVCVFISKVMSLDDAKDFAKSTAYHDDFWKDRPMHMGWSLGAEVQELGKADLHRKDRIFRRGVSRRVWVSDREGRPIPTYNY